MKRKILIIAMTLLVVIMLTTSCQNNPIVKNTTSNTMPYSTTTEMSIPQQSPLFTANIAKLNNPSGSKFVYMIFYNGSQDYCTISCDVRQRDSNGNYLSDCHINSNWLLSPKSHAISSFSQPLLPNGEFTISNLNVNIASPTPRLAKITLKDIIKTYTTDGIYLSGTLLNNDTNITPEFIKVQILKHMPDGSFTIAFGNYSPNGTTNEPKNQFGGIIPPPNEKVSFAILLYEDITILDSKNALIDGEINIFAGIFR